MKTITVKANNEFEAILNQLASRLNTTRSDAIRDAVRRYMQHLDKEALKQKIRKASLKTRAQAVQAMSDFEAADSDGI